MIELIVGTLSALGLAGLGGAVLGRRVRSSWTGGPMPMTSDVASSPYTGSIRLVGSRGMERRSTYRGVYLTNPWVFGAVNKISRDIARSPLHTFLLAADGRRARIRGDVPTDAGRPSAGEVLDRRLRYPSGGRSRFALWFGTATDRLVYGNSLWEIQADPASSMPGGILRRRWRDVSRVQESRDGEPLFYELAPTSSTPLFGSTGRPPIRLGPEQVVHFGRGMDSEGAVGISPLESCRYSIALYEAVVRQLVAYFENEARPSGVIQKDNLTRETADLIRELITEWYASPENAGKVLVTSGEWKQVTDTPDHNKVIELLHLAREEVAVVFGVPPPVIGILENAIKSNVKELREQYLREGVGPWNTEFEEEVHDQFIRPVPPWAYHFVRFQLAEQLRPDLEARSQVYDRLKFMYSIDRLLELEDEQPYDIPGVTDVPWVDSGAMPISAWENGKNPLARGAQNPPTNAPAATSNGHGDTEALETAGWEDR